MGTGLFCFLIPKKEEGEKMKAMFSCCSVSVSVLLLTLSLCAHASEERFSRSTDGVITDSQTNLQWLVGPNQDTNYKQAENWVAAQTVAGGSWRMPTAKELILFFIQDVTDPWPIG
jgi:hypothetical protein